MLNNKNIKIVAAAILLFILGFGLISSVSVNESVDPDETSNHKNPIPVKDSTNGNHLNKGSAGGSSKNSDIDLVNDSDDDSDDDELDDDSDDSDDDELDVSDNDLVNGFDNEENNDSDDNYNEYGFEWKENIYSIDLNRFNLSDEELTELFTKRDDLIGGIDNLEVLIQEMFSSRNNNTLLAIDVLYDSINNITNNTEFNVWLLSLKDINILEINSTFDELKTILEFIKADFPDEDFAEIDFLMNNLEFFLNDELKIYENLISDLDEEFTELSKFFGKYPFLKDYTKYDNIYFPNYYEFEWNGKIYHIDLNLFNLTDEELIELLTKRDVLMEEIDNLESLIQEMELSRNNDILLAIDDLYDSMNNIINNTDFNDLLLSLKDINITELNSTFNDLKILLESIKSDLPDEDFTEIDFLMDNLETLLNDELEKYENLTLELNEKLAELFDLFAKYPFLSEHTKYDSLFITSCAVSGGKYPLDTLCSVPEDGGHDVGDGLNKAKTLAKMKDTGIQYLSLLLLLGLFGFSIKKKLIM